MALFGFLVAFFWPIEAKTNPPLLLILKGFWVRFAKKTFFLHSSPLVNSTNALRLDFPAGKFRGQQNYSEYSDYSENSEDPENSENSENSEDPENPENSKNGW